MNFKDYAIRLSEGSHTNPQQGMCIMECVAYIAGEEHTDHPKCASGTLTQAAITLNDRAHTPADRQRLLPLVLRLAASKGTPHEEARRNQLLAQNATAWEQAAVELERTAHGLQYRRNSDPHPFHYDPTQPISVYMAGGVGASPKFITHSPYSANGSPAFTKARWESLLTLVDALLPPLPEGVEVADDAKARWADQKLKELVKITANAKSAKKLSIE